MAMVGGFGLLGLLITIAILALLANRVLSGTDDAADVRTGWLPPEIALDRHGYVLTGSDVRAAGRWELERDPYLLETSVPGIFASGDVRYGPVKRVAAAVGEGSMAIAFVHQYLRDAETGHGPS